ncbi:MAG: twin-arginine translocase TatA/TatE family subunit [Bacteroidetes bacterium]|nr:twin-arginine translocase TatA/TatE family subunit [Bacteroidota bacterium]
MIQNLLLAFSFQELLPIIIIILILFGGKKIPELMRGMGRGIREFQDAKNNVKKEIEDSANDETRSVKE